MNHILRRLLDEDDVVPVLANVPRAVSANRRRRQSASAVSRVLGEADEEPTIPDDAEDIERSEVVLGKPMRQPKEVVQEPSHPTGNREKLLTPYSALTAPDVTPGITQPIDRSKVPGQINVKTEFTAKDTAATPEPMQPEPVRGEDAAVRAMDVLLGRERTTTPPEKDKERQQFDQAGALATAEAVTASTLASMNAGPINESYASGLVQGAGMPDHKEGDARTVCNAFRKFTS
jgi:hypothetical protein